MSDMHERKCCGCAFLIGGWPDAQEPIYTDNEGKDYCVFHAPSDQKRLKRDGATLNISEFNELVYARINAAIFRKEPVILSGAIFPGAISFSRYSKFNPLPSITLFCAKFEGVANFSETRFSGVADFRGTKFFEEASFKGTTFDEFGYFDGAHFYKRTGFFECASKDHALRMRYLSANSMANLLFTCIDTAAISFVGCQRPVMLGLEMHRNNIMAGASYQDCEELYRTMKQKAAESHDQPQVSHWHFREKLMQLKAMLNNDRSNDLLEVVEDRDAKWGERAKAWFKLLWHRPHWPKLTLTGIYWATSGFGERAVRAGVWLVALLALSFLANAWTPDWSWNEVMPWAAAANATMATIPFAKDIPGEGWVKVGRGVWQFLIAVQFTLFALAVRNRFRR